MAQNRAECQEKLARASNTTDHQRERRARDFYFILAGALRHLNDFGIALSFARTVCANLREARRELARITAPHPQGAVPSGHPLALDRRPSPAPCEQSSPLPPWRSESRPCVPAPAVAPHPQVELVEAAAVAGVGPRIDGPSGTAPLSTEAIGDGGLRIAPVKICFIGTRPRIFLTWQMYRLGMAAHPRLYHSRWPC